MKNLVENKAFVLDIVTFKRKILWLKKSLEFTCVKKVTKETLLFTTKYYFLLQKLLTLYKYFIYCLKNVKAFEL